MEKGMVIPVVDVLKPYNADLGQYGFANIPDGSWYAEGELQTLIQNDTSFMNAVRQDPWFVENVMVIALDLDLHPVSRYTKEVGFRRLVGQKEWVMRSDCFWVSTEPFAILIVQTIRRIADSCVSYDTKLRLRWPRLVIDGVADTPLPVTALRVVKSAAQPNQEAEEWVKLSDLAKAVKIDPAELIKGLLGLDIFDLNIQATFVCAKDEAALMAASYTLYPDVVGVKPPSTIPNEKEVLIENVWVAAPAAADLMWLISLGVKSDNDLSPLILG